MRRLCLLTLVLLLLGAPLRAEPSLTYSGEVTLLVDTIWQGEVLVDGILTVPPEVTLEIRPGTQVRFTRFDSNDDGIGEHEIFIQGHLRVLGTAEEPVVFASAEERPHPGDWGAINIMASTERENLLRHLLVSSAYRGFHGHFARVALEDCVFTGNRRAVQFQESTVRMERCRVAGNGNGVQFRDSQVAVEDCLIAGNYWGLRCVYSDLSLRRSRIEDNLINGANLRDSTLQASGNIIAGNRRGLYLQRSSGSVEGNLLSGNSEHGILLEDSTAEVVANRIAGNGRAGVKWIDSQGPLRGNDLAGNGEYALYNEGENLAEVSDNWWGTTDPAAIAGRIFDGRDRAGLGLVEAASPLTAAPDLALPVSLN